MAVKYKGENGWEDLRELWVKEDDNVWYPCMGEASVYSWRSSAWSACTAICGGGIQTRTVECVDANGTVVADSTCELLIGPKPDTQRYCNTFSCPDCRYVEPAAGATEFYFWKIINIRLGDKTEVYFQVAYGTSILRNETYTRNTGPDANNQIAQLEAITEIIGPDGFRYTRGTKVVDRLLETSGVTYPSREQAWQVCRNFN